MGFNKNTYFWKSIPTCTAIEEQLSLATNKVLLYALERLFLFASIISVVIKINHKPLNQSKRKVA